MEEKKILDTSVVIEGSQGPISIFSTIEYPPCSLQSIDYLKGVEIAQKLRQRGKPVGAIDILLAAMCLNRSAKLITKDADFRLIKDVEKELQL